MALGHIVGTQCLDVASAGHAYANSLPRSLTFDGTNTHLHLTVYDPNDNEFQIRHFTDGAYTDFAILTPTFSTCDTTEGFFDGMQLGWAVAAVMVIVYVIRRPYR